ncbi:MAG: Cytoplasmic and mitochondrial histidine tRNA synthetase [Vezdaea aestivalis]|nr:MAG: Cytoplasmic and mitochondrial histidine tRNA synthetase [Vezdaea aestivalis]
MGKDKAQFHLKTAKGTRDWDGKDIIIRDRIFSAITQVFKNHGAVTIDTPAFELKEILAGKYGEDSKLIYDLQDQGGELCSLRYDLTVPFARYLAMNPSFQNIKRYHLAKVYRRDHPAIAKGRMREFYQCDFDIAGNYDQMLPDAEIVRIICEVFRALGWKDAFTIKINHRKILDGIFEVCGVPAEKIRTISSAVDKLDKLPWADVRREMTEEKGLEDHVADAIGKYVVQKGSVELLKMLRTDTTLLQNISASKGLEDMELLFTYLSAFSVLPQISFDLSLARGLDYYTGVIFEVVTEGSAPPSMDSKAHAPPVTTKKASKLSKSEDEDRSSDPSIGIGSIAAGGRYDGLVGMFNPKAKIPCVGISFGVDRIFNITKTRMLAKNQSAVRASEVDVYVMAFGGAGFTGLLTERMQIVKSLWDAGIKAEFSYKVKPKLPAQFKAADAAGIPFAVILGEDEQAQGKLKIKEMGLPDGHPEKQVPRLGTPGGLWVGSDCIRSLLEETVVNCELGSDDTQLAIGPVADSRNVSVNQNRRDQSPDDSGRFIFTPRPSRFGIGMTGVATSGRALLLRLLVAKPSAARSLSSAKEENFRVNADRNEDIHEGVSQQAQWNDARPFFELRRQVFTSAFYRSMGAPASVDALNGSRATHTNSTTRGSTHLIPANETTTLARDLGDDSILPRCKPSKGKQADYVLLIRLGGNPHQFSSLEASVNLARQYLEAFNVSRSAQIGEANFSIEIVGRQLHSTYWEEAFRQFDEIATDLTKFEDDEADFELENAAILASTRSEGDASELSEIEGSELDSYHELKQSQSL